MKQCPECKHVYYDETLNFCLDDGVSLVNGPTADGPATAVITYNPATRDDPTKMFVPGSAASDHSTSGTSLPRKKHIGSSRNSLLAGAAVALAIVLAGVGYVTYRWAANPGKPVPSFQSAKLQRLTTSGKASDAAISPDGKWIAHVKSDTGQHSLWLRQVATTSDTQIVPPSPQIYFGITFSKDGNYIYYVLGDANNLPARTLHVVPVLGGTSRKLAENVFSPSRFHTTGSVLHLFGITYYSEKLR